MKKVLLTLAIAGMTTMGAFAGNHDKGCNGKGCHCKGNCKTEKCTMKCCTGGKKACKDPKCMKNGKCTKTDKAADKSAK